MHNTSSSFAVVTYPMLALFNG